MKSYIIFFCILFFIEKTHAQVDFTIPDSICAGVSFTPVNNSRNATTYFWHFCSSNLSYVPSSLSVAPSAEPSFIDIAEDKGNFYGFVTNNRSRNFIRLNFGNSLLNVPVIEDTFNLGGMIPDHAQGIQIARSNGKWYGFIVGGLGDDDKLIRVAFGDSLRGTPAPTNLGNIGNLDYPVDLTLFNEGGTWIGFTVNILSHTITRFNFGADLSNTPVSTNLGNRGQLNRPFGICPVKDGSSWRFFITNSGTNSITRVDFGSSLLNDNPEGHNLGSSALLNTPYDVAIIQDCEQTFGFIANSFNKNLVRLDFPNGLTGDIVYTPLPISGIKEAHGMSKVYRVDNEIFVFVTDMASKNIQRLYYTTCDAASPATSVERNPSSGYLREGNYNVSLILDQGLATEEFTCRNITVLEKPEVSLGNDTSICPNNKITLGPREEFTSYLWNTGTTNKSIIADTIGSYWIEVTNENNCKERDTLVLSHYPDLLNLGSDTSFTLGEAIVLDAGNGYITYSWSTGETENAIRVIKPGQYSVTVKQLITNCIFRDTIHITLENDLPNFVTPNGDTYNDTWLPKLFFHYPESEITIFDRYGKTIARFKGSNEGWNATYNGKPVRPDTYWYIVDLKDGSKPITGSITVKIK